MEQVFNVGSAKHGAFDKLIAAVAAFNEPAAMLIGYCVLDRRNIFFYAVYKGKRQMKPEGHNGIKNAS